MGKRNKTPNGLYPGRFRLSQAFCDWRQRSWPSIGVRATHFHPTGLDSQFFFGTFPGGRWYTWKYLKTFQFLGQLWHPHSPLLVTWWQTKEDGNKRIKRVCVVLHWFSQRKKNSVSQSVIDSERGKTKEKLLPLHLFLTRPALCHWIKSVCGGKVTESVNYVNSFDNVSTVWEPAGEEELSDFTHSSN